MPVRVAIPITFERGVNVFDRPSVLADGELQVLQNFEWTPNGGLVPRPAWKAAGSGGAPTGSPASGARAGRGLFTNWYESGVRKLVVATKDAGNAFSFYKTATADPTSFASYSAIETAVAVASAQAGDPVGFAIGNNKLVYTNPGFPTGRLRKYDGATVTAIPTDNIAGRFVVYHLNRFWTGGSLTNPTYLRFSEIGDETLWNTEENFIPVGQDDGEPPESCVIWDRGLVIGKQHSLWFLSGRDLNSFNLSPIHPSIGCTRGVNALVPTEFGVFIVGLDGQVYLWDGADVKQVTRKIEMATGGYVSAAFVQGKLIVLHTGVATTLWVWDQEGRRWRSEVTQDSTNAPRDLAVYDDHYLLATASGATGRVLSVRGERGPFVAGSGYRDPAHDAGVGEDYIATTKEVWPQGSGMGKSTLRQFYIRYYQWASGTNPKLTVTPVVEGVDGTPKTVGGKAAAGTYVERLDFASEGRGIALRFSSSPTNSQNPTYSIEECSEEVLVDRGSR